MKAIRESAKILLAAGMTFGAGLVPAMAEFPEQPVTLIVSGGAGGGADVPARTYQPFLERCLGPSASVVVVNRPGAGGALAFAELVKAKPDGYTIGYLNMPGMAAQTIAGDTPWKIDSFDYIANVVASRVTLNVAKDSPYNTVQEFVDYAKANPKVVTLALSSLGGDDHLTQLQFLRAAGIEATIVNFGDGAASRAALMGGHVTAASMSGPEASTYQDQLKTLWIAAEERSPFLPDVPTLTELGFPVIGGSNHIIGAPKGVPADALEKIRGCYEKAISDPEFLKEAEKRQIPVHFMNAADTEAFVKAQYDILSDLWKATPWVAK
jgi:tripartite-type tricarboxylate transporter receptor subunit TctC